ncbi:methylated-DNA--[protein]-cysteine S-methyltransferase [Frateuria aurantia]
MPDTATATTALSTGPARGTGSDPSAAQRAQQVAELCRWIAAAETEPSLGELARHAGLSPGHLQRVFKAVTGLSPKAWARADRAARLRHELRHSRSVSDAIYAAGYQSDGHVYDLSARLLGMSPGTYRRGSTGLALHVAIAHSSLGAVLIAATPRGVAAIMLGDDPEALLQALQRQFPGSQLAAANADYEALVAQVVAVVEHPSQPLDLPLDLQGTAFQHRVWHALRQIPPGTTLSYAELAARIGAPKAVRAVAGACAANRVAVAVPCHRVVHRDGSLSGYRWGVERKRELLARETGEASLGRAAMPAEPT